MAPRQSRSSAEGRCREHGPKEGSAFQFKGEEGSPPQTARRSPASGLEDQGGLMAKAQAEEAQTQLATRIPKDLHRRLKLHCVTHDIAVMHFVVQAIEEKLGRKPGPKKRAP